MIKPRVLVYMAAVFASCIVSMAAFHMTEPWPTATSVVLAALVVGLVFALLAVQAQHADDRRRGGRPAASPDLLADDRGSVAITAAVAFLLLCVCGAFSLDLARAFNAKNKLQDSLDAATLRAASEVDVTLGEAVGLEALAANLDGETSMIAIKPKFTVTKDGVNATATATVVPFFLGMPLKGPIDVKASTEVKRAVNPLELALVLDTTASMSGAKITTLKTAATSLVDKLMADSASDVKIAVVPFAQYVNVGKSRRNEPWLTNSKDYTTTKTTPAKCVKTTPKTCKTKKEDYDCSTWSDGKKTKKTCSRTVNIPGTCVNGTPYQTCTPAVTSGTTYTWSGCVGSPVYPNNVQDSDPSRTYPGQSKTCATEITPLTTTKLTVTNAIKALTVANSTYIPSGLAWGLNALSPAVPLTEGAAYDPVSNRRPRKAMVLMTDGENTLRVQSDGTHIDVSPLGSVATQANGYTTELCNNIKAAKIELFTVAFEVTDATAKAMLKGCATDDAHYFDASDQAKLLKAFEDIAGKLRDLYIAK